MNKVKRIKLTRKERELARIIATEPGTSNKDAYRRVYNTTTTNDNTVNAEASRTINKPHVKAQIERYSNLVENALINTINDYKDSNDIKERTLAINTSQFIYQHIHGKPKSSVEVTNKTLELKLDLTGVTDSPEVLEG